MTLENTTVMIHESLVLATRLLPRLAVALAIVVGFRLGGAALEAAVTRVGRRRHLDVDLTRLLGRVTRLTLMTFGVLTAIGTLGIDVKALVAGLGLTGFALGFALKDIISNSLAGILILTYKPFRRGDRIDVAGSAGRVELIDLRYTTLTIEEGGRVLVPNSTLFTNSIKVMDAPGTPHHEPDGPGDAKGAGGAGPQGSSSASTAI
jgi:small conductance mechanosensitive channel